MRKHSKEAREVPRNKIKAWLVAGFVTVLHIPCNAFNSMYMKILFWLARLGTVNDKIARQLSDQEVEYVICYPSVSFGMRIRLHGYGIPYIIFLAD